MASIFINAAEKSVVCASILCWRWPFLVEIFLLSPLYLALYFVPAEHMDLSVRRGSSSSKQLKSNIPNTVSPTGAAISAVDPDDACRIPASENDVESARRTPQKDSITLMTESSKETAKLISNSLDREEKRVRLQSYLFFLADILM